MRIYLASGNPHKAEEFQELAGPQIEIRPAGDLGGMPRVVEDSGSFEGNARLKARALACLLPVGTWALADDSGLCVEALGGAPGVESAYFAGPQGDPAANLAKLVALLRGVPQGKRGASFHCVLCLVSASGIETMAHGRCQGSLRVDPIGGGGFGYDPLFIPEGHALTFAELGAPTKATLSHRARAWRNLGGPYIKPERTRAVWP